MCVSMCVSLYMTDTLPLFPLVFYVHSLDGLGGAFQCPMAYVRELFSLSLSLQNIKYNNLIMIVTQIC